MLSQDEINRRKPVWVALSNLWLDTELEEQDLRAIAQVLRTSDYNIATLRDIYLYEVAPVVYKNLLSPAGEWVGFDPDWLCAEAAKWALKRSKLSRARLRLQQRLMTYATEQHRHRLEQLLETPARHWLHFLAQ